MKENNNGNDTNVGSIEEDIKILKKLISAMKSDRELFTEKTDKEIYTFFINALEHILSDYKRVLKENEELENITDKMIDYIMMHQQVKTMRKIFCKHCKLQNSCTYSGIHRNCVIRYFEYISKQGDISKMHEELEKILESEE